MSRAELLFGIGGLVATSLLANAALTQSQKEWVRRRDGDKCRVPVRHNCGGTPPDQHQPIHHDLPQGYCKKVGIDPDFAENLTTTCQNFHDILHPDVPETRKKYREDHNAFDKLQQERRRKLDSRQPYWNTEYDRILQVNAVKRTQEYLREHPEDKFPDKPTPRKTTLRNKLLNVLGD